MCSKEIILLVIILHRMISRLGESVTLNCTFTHDAQQYMSWYKQRPGEMPVALVTAQTLSAIEFQSGFNASDYTVKKDKGIFHLTINRTTVSDEAFYFCGLTKFFHAVFGNGTFVALTDHRNHRLDLSAEIQTSVPDPVDPENPKTLECTVLTETRTTELSVFWFRPSSGGSHPVNIYIQKNCSSESGSGFGSHTQSCVYRLPVGHTSDSGTFYCAVASYGQLLFGNQVTLDKKQTDSVDPVIVSLAAALALCIVVIIVLASLSCRRTTCKDCKAAHHTAGHNPLRAQAAGQGHEEEVLNYAALQFTKGKSNSGQKKKRPAQESTYSGVRSSRL
ncbi:uncharacterized protein LOC134095855 isoform X2 [Sardina pilchardus]|uniref:uncharacterized protein LOC134095855 isoform X2 n=1 Tax=Sardina pilchardus TaxID=27697 RepID=UPI002E0E86C5